MYAIYGIDRAVASSLREVWRNSVLPEDLLEEAVIRSKKQRSHSACFKWLRLSSDPLYCQLLGKQGIYLVSW
jgi:hypothetical protein